MKKSNSFKNITLLIELFLNNSLNGLLNRPLLKQKSIRLIIIFGLLSAYLAYFLYNMKELVRIIPDSNSIEQDLLLQGQKITFFSFFSNSLTLAVIISIFINSTLDLDKTSLFFVKSLPFKKNDVKIAYLFFKFSIMFLIYELVMLIATPAIQLVTTQPLEYVIFFLSQHIFFLNTIIIIEFLKIVTDILPNRIQKASDFLLDCFFLIGSVIYFFNLRYPFEMMLAGIKLTVSNLILIAAILNTFVLLIMLFLLIKVPSSDRINNSLKFIKLPFFTGPILRYKANLKIIIFALITIGIVFVQNGYRTTFSVLPSFLSFSGVLLLNYADTTADFRIQYSLLRITVVDEWFEQIKNIVFLSGPLITLVLLSHKNWEQLVISISLSATAIVLGYLFPKSKGSLNESSSLIILVIVCVLVTILVSSISFGYVVMIFILTIHYTIIKKVRYESIL